MPLSKEKRAKYPKNWAAIRAEVLARANMACECTGECKADHQFGGRCFLVHGSMVMRGKPEEELGVQRRVRIVLTIAHLNHNPKDSRRANLKAMCQRCHLRYDLKLHQANAAATRMKKAGQLPLWGGRDV
jgi:hypothetical protein